MGSTPSKLSASRGAAALGLSKWASPLDTWLKIMQETHGEGWLIERGYEPIVREDKALFDFGLAFEDPICALIEERDGTKVTDREGFYECEAQPHATCHIDGRVSGNTLVENKTANIRTWRDSWGEPGSEQIPENYLIQCQQQLACTGATECIVNVLVFPKMVDEWVAEGKEITRTEKGTMVLNFDPYYWAAALSEMGFLHQYPIRRNQTLIDLMLEKYELFWNDYVLTQTPPPAACYNDITKLLTNPCGTIVASKEIERISALDKALADEIKSANKKRAEYKTLIGQYLKDNIEGAPIDADSRAKVMLMSRDGHKLRSYSKKGGLR